jgi:hypothetical protein
MRQKKSRTSAGSLVASQELVRSHKHNQWMQNISCGFTSAERTRHRFFQTTELTDSVRQQIVSFDKMPKAATTAGRFAYPDQWLYRG